MDVVASHGVVDDPSRLLKRAGAPYKLCDWASGRRIDALWEECDRGDWLIWLAAVERVPLWSLVHAAAACAKRAVKRLDSGRKRLRAAVHAAQKMESQSRVIAHAERCESVAAKPEADRYAQPPPTTERWAASSAGLTARAAEGLLRAEAKRAGERQAEARHIAAVIGAGDQIMGTGRLPPATYDVDEPSTQYCVDAAANAVRHAVDALLPAGADEAQIEKAEGKLADVVFELLDPVRRELRAGVDARELVPEINIARLPQREAGEEGAMVAPKKAYIAVIAAIILPGAGHHYAEHRVLGTVLTSSIIGMVMLSILTAGWWSWGGVLLILVDAILAPGAVRRRNANKIMAPRSQLQMGILLVACVCVVLWWFHNA